MQYDHTVKFDVKMSCLYIFNINNALILIKLYNIEHFGIISITHILLIMNVVQIN